MSKSINLVHISHSLDFTLAGCPEDVVPRETRQMLNCEERDAVNPAKHGFIMHNEHVRNIIVNGREMRIPTSVK